MPRFFSLSRWALPVVLWAGAVCAGDAGVLPPGEPPFDPKPLMAKVEASTLTDKFRFAVLGDSKHSALLPPLLKYMDEKINPAFVLFTGDIVSNGARETGEMEYRQLVTEIGPQMRKRPWWVTVGNHELDGAVASGEDNFQHFFNLNAERYSFTFRNAVFLSLPFPQPEGANEKWLEQELAKASAAGKLIFVFNHVPFYTVGNKGTGEVPNKPTQITALFEKYHVLAVFSGHDHTYYRTVRRGIPYIVSAGAGANIYPLTRRKEALPEDVYYGVDPATRQHTLHLAAGKEKTFAGQQTFLCVVDVDGNNVNCVCYNSLGEKWDELKLK